MPLVAGLGVYEKGKYPASKGGVANPYYNRWSKMIVRCYCPKSLSVHPSYTDCSVDVRFHNFQNFMLWAEKQHGFGLPDVHLDKDVVIAGNRVYSPDTCVFIPPEINMVLSAPKVRSQFGTGVTYRKDRDYFQSALNVCGLIVRLGSFSTAREAAASYKQAKERHVKEVAEKYKPVIDVRVYKRLVEYEVELYPS